MRIWIEATLVARGGGGGSRRYAERIVAGLLAAGEDVRVIAERGKHEFGAPILRPFLPARLLHLAWALGRWPPLTRVVSGPPPDLVHAVEKVGVPPLPAGIRLVVTVHDVWCIDRPGMCGGRLGFLTRRSWRAREKWDLVLTPSAATGQDVIELGVSPDRVRVVPSGVTDAFLHPPGDPGPLRERFALRDPNLVFVGPLSRKKGGDLLLAAFDLLRRRGHPDLQLVVRGPDDLEEIRPRLDPRIIESARTGLRFLPQLSDDHLAALYSQATAVVCPSRMEGYNLPLVEALSVGAVVVATGIPVHREMSQGKAILVAAEDPEALAAGIEEALAGRRPEGDFTPPRWEDAIAGTLEAYREAVARG